MQEQEILKEMLEVNRKSSFQFKTLERFYRQKSAKEKSKNKQADWAVAADKEKEKAKQTDEYVAFLEELQK